jgi:hypothetical protein
MYIQLTEAWHELKQEDWKPCLNSLVPSKGEVMAFSRDISNVNLDCLLSQMVTECLVL